jgi:dTDP-4-dehydrorhamnose reductase
MKKILITGANGYVGKHIISAFKDNEQIVLTLLTHQQLDLTNEENITGWFKDKHFDWIIHCASDGVRQSENNTDVVYVNNMQMFKNLISNQKSFDKLISFGSGAELDIRYNINDKSDVWKVKPIDNYGLSKNKIAKFIDITNNFYNIRLFGIFAIDEPNDRFIKANLMRYIRNEPMIIHQDRYMDFFAMEDLITIVKNYIFNDDILILPKHLDAVYEEKLKLSEICKYINRFEDTHGHNKQGNLIVTSSRQVEIQIQKEGMNLDYVGTYNEKFMKYCEVLQDIESIWYRISAMHTKLKETYGTEPR